MRTQKSHFACGTASHQGLVRERNEDTYVCPRTHRDSSDAEHTYKLPTGRSDRLYIVADGVGGSEEGQRASQLAAKTVARHYYRQNHAIDIPVDQLERALIAANDTVNAYCQEMNTTAATTLTALLIDGRRGYVAHAGDSRLYRIRGKSIVQLTQDHDLAWESVRNGSMTEEQARTSSLQHVITRGIGSQPDLIPDVAEIVVQPGDDFILCSDGLTRHVLDEEITHVIRKTHNPQCTANALVDLALERGGKDNITVVVLHSKRRKRMGSIFLIIQLLAVLILVAGLIWTMSR